MLYVVLGYDGSDADAPARRAMARPAHLEALRPLKEAGIVTCAGALLDDTGERVIGSMLVLDYPSEAVLRAEFLAKEPYVIHGVWEKITIHPFRPPSDL